ncbi:MAG: alginate export family protein [Acetobacter sp.]|uniref:alginate export family protein n=1 Tax=Acetobacter sp. TaxID=440 RepID=UPI0039EB2480
MSTNCGFSSPGGTPVSTCPSTLFGHFALSATAPASGRSARPDIGPNRVSAALLLAGTSALLCLYAAPAWAETAPQAGHLQYSHTPPTPKNGQTTVTVPTAAQPVATPATRAPPAGQMNGTIPPQGSWNNVNLLPPLTSRPEAYGQPQALELKPLPSSLLHQGPWGVFNANTGAAAGFGTVGYYAVSRWAEDWSSLRDKRNHIDFMDPLKYIPLNETGDIYLTFSGNFRQHNFYDQRAGFGATKTTPAYRNNYRSNLGADLHLGEHVRLYGELMSGQAAGVNYYGYAGGRWRSTLDAQQAFIEVRGHVLGATVGGMAGRMTFLDAPPYFTAGSVYPSVPYSWNGLRGYAFWKNFRLDVFDLLMTNNAPPGIFHDQVNWKTRLYGAYSSYALPKFRFLDRNSQIFVDTFFLGFNLANVAIPTAKSSIAGATHRYTPGTRIWGNAGPIEFSVGAMWQGGGFQATKTGLNRSVSAYAIDATLSWRFAHWAGHPVVGVQVDDVSGGNMNKSQTSSWGNFMSPFVPSAYYLDMSTYIGQSNIITAGPIATVSPTSNTTLLMKVPAIWRNSTQDAIYASGTAFYKYRPHGSYVATMPQASFTWRATRHITLSIDGEYIFASKTLIRDGGSSGAFVQSNLELTF